MSREQRWAASGVVLLLGAIWGGIALVGVTEPWRDTGPPDDSMGMVWVWLISSAALAAALAWLGLGLLTVRRVASGAWRWRVPAGLGIVGAVLSLLYAAGSLGSGPVWWVLVLGFQALGLLAWSALLWTPAPSGGRVEAPRAVAGPVAGADQAAGRDA